MTNSHKQWANRIVGYGTADPEQLLANPKNWRLHPEFQQKALSGVLATVGWVDDIIINVGVPARDPNTGVVLDGHARVNEAIKAGQREVPVKYVSLNDDEEALILLTYDSITGLAGSDKEQIAGLLEHASSGNADVMALLSHIAETNSLYGLDGAGDGDDSSSGDDGLPGGPLQYTLIFDSEEQQQRWLEFMRSLRERYPDDETISQRLDKFLEESGVSI